MPVYSVNGSIAGKQLNVTCRTDELSRTFIRPSPVHVQSHAIGTVRRPWAKMHFIKAMKKEELEFCNRYTD